jgi:hypothetical protein
MLPRELVVLLLQLSMLITEKRLFTFMVHIYMMQRVELALEIKS